jgi:UDP-glucose 4-epimerase
VPSALVTGGGGFIGSNVVRTLLEEGFEVRVLDDFSTGHRVNLEPFHAVDVREGDIRDAGAVAAAVDSIDVVFHLAAAVGNMQSIEDPVRDSEINLLGTLNVLEAARSHQVPRIVYSSSAAVFGELKDLPIREDHALEPNSPYGVSKLAGEKLCLAYASLYGISVACLRYFNVYGLNQRYDAYGNVIPIFVQRLVDGEPLTVFSDGEQTRDFVNVQDVAQANLLAATCDDVSGAFNIASGTSITINELVSMLERAGGVSLRVEYAPPRAGDVRDSIADTGAARAAFGYVPSVGLEEGLTGYVEWFRSTAEIRAPS